MIKLKDILTEQSEKEKAPAGGKITLVATDTAAAPNASTFTAFNSKHKGVTIPAGVKLEDMALSGKKWTGSQNSWNIVKKSVNATDYLKIGQVIITNQSSISILNRSNIRTLLGPIEASGNGVFLLSRIMEAGFQTLNASKAVILKMGASKAGIKTIVFNPGEESQKIRRINSGAILSAYAMIQAGVATKEFLESRDFAISTNYSYESGDVATSPAFFPSLKDQSFLKNSEMIALGQPLKTAVASFINKYKGQKLEPDTPPGSMRSGHYKTPWRKSATTDLVAMRKILGDTFKLRHRKFVELNLAEFGAPASAGDALYSSIDSFWNKVGPYEAKVTTLFGPSKKGGGGSTSTARAGSAYTQLIGKSGQM